MNSIKSKFTILTFAIFFGDIVKITNGNNVSDCIHQLVVVGKFDYYDKTPHNIIKHAFKITKKSSHHLVNKHLLNKYMDEIYHRVKQIYTEGIPAPYEWCTEIQRGTFEECEKFKLKSVFKYCKTGLSALRTCLFYLTSLSKKDDFEKSYYEYIEATFLPLTVNTRGLRSPELFCVEKYSTDEIDMNELPASSFAARRPSRRIQNRSESTSTNTSENGKFPTAKGSDLNMDMNGVD